MSLFEKSEESLKDQNIPNTTNKELNEPMIFSPFNSKNREVTSNDILAIFRKYNLPYYKIHNMAIYKRAFVHRSYTKRPDYENKLNNIVIEDCPEDCIPLKTKSNERLEFLGDGVLECVTKYCLYERFPKEDEGFMTQKKIAIVKNEHIGKLAYDIGLQEFFIISKHAEEKNTRTNIKKLGCLFEAFIGAIFLDFNKTPLHDEEKWFKDVFKCGPGFQMAQMFIERVFERHIDWISLLKDDDNYKNILQVKIQKEFKTTPTYIIIEQTDDLFHMGVYLVINYNGEIDPKMATDITTMSCLPNYDSLLDTCESLFVLLGNGQHKIKKKAEQLASENAIHNIDKKLK